MEDSGSNSNLFPRSNTASYVYATVHHVDTKNNVFDAIGQDGLRFIKNCQYLDITTDLAGEIKHPSSGDTCVIKIEPDGSTRLEKIYTVTQVNSDGVPSINLGPYANTMPGDRILLAKGGSFLQLLRNGLTKIGVTPLCQIIFMKMENYSRWITRQLEIQTSALRFYSVNDGGDNTVRLSLFLKDALSLALRDASSNSSDFELVMKDSDLTLLCGPKGPDGNRINVVQISLSNTGILDFINYDQTTQNMTRRITMTPDGCTDHVLYDNNNAVIYEKITTRLTQAFGNTNQPQVDINEQILGSKTTTSDFNITLTAGQNLIQNANNIYNVAVVAHSTQGASILEEADVYA